MGPTRPLPSPAVLRRLLWIDCLGAFAVGVGVLALSVWLAPFLGLPLWFVIGEGLANLAYGSFSYSLARQPSPPLRRVRLLAAMNMAWGAMALMLAVVLYGTVTPFGTAHLVINVVYVGGLGLMEWRAASRDRLAVS